MSEPPPNKRIKTGQEFMELINQCYDLQFRNPRTEEEEDYLKSGIQRIRETLGFITSSSDVSFGVTRTSAKINWGKCVGLLLENELDSLKAMQVLTSRLTPGGGLL